MQTDGRRGSNRFAIDSLQAVNQAFHQKIAGRIAAITTSLDKLNQILKQSISEVKGWGDPLRR